LLQGEKVILRAPMRDDLRRMWEFRNDLEMELAGGGDPPWPVSYEIMEREFGSGQSTDDRPGFAIEADGKYIGGCALFNFNWTARSAECGIGIGDPAYRNRGYGRDALKVLLDYAFRLRNLNRVWLNVHANNERAVKSYRAAGFVDEGLMRQHAWSDGHFVDVLIMGVLRDEWEH
jgi:RimJ/RimL family protein N-acetyltransferase